MVSDMQRKWLKDVISDFVPGTSYRDHQEIRAVAEETFGKQTSISGENPKLKSNNN